MNIRCGSSRLVILTRRFAFKVPHPGGWKRFLWGLLANMQEGEFGRLDWPELCPLLFSIPGGFLVVMERADPCTDDNFIRPDPHPERLVPAENKPSSWGRLQDGRLVAIDYG